MENVMPALIAIIGIIWLVWRKKAIEDVMNALQKYINRGRPLSKLQRGACQFGVVGISICFIVFGTYDTVRMLLG
jgi:hypothetical protein